MLRWLFGLALGVGAPIAACSSSSTSSASAPDAGANVDAAPANDEDSGAEEAAALAPNPLPGCPQDPGPSETSVNASSPSDPIGGADKFTLAQALAGYPQATGVLTALITTEAGTIRCDLDEAAAPISVANFVGLARGTRPFKASNKWKVGRFYDGLLWHRVIPDFVIQGGDPKGTGTGGPGYDLVVENHVPELFGTLAMAAGDTPSGSQFYIVVGNGPAPDYNVFGRCETATAVSIAAQPRSDSDKPLAPIHMQRIDIARCPTGIADPGVFDAGTDAGTDGDAG
jgi:peptidyl-prolyl cis-trans isomerase A (cyclophilin A)